MENKTAKSNRRFLLIVCAICFALILPFLFSACDEVPTLTEEKDYMVYVVEASVSEDGAEGFVRVGFTTDSATENILSGVTAHAEKYTKQSFWFSYADYYYTIDGAALETAVKQYVSAKGSEALKNVDDSGLKVSYQYATIYKSTTSDGSVEKISGSYVHKWIFGLGDDVSLRLSARSEIRASWYAVVIAASVVLVAATSATMHFMKKDDKDRLNENSADDTEDKRKEAENG